MTFGGIPMRPNVDDPELIVTDHEYVGNVCSGFGGELICVALDLEGGFQCGLGPYQHRYNPPRHRGEVEEREQFRPNEVGRHAGEPTR